MASTGRSCTRSLLAASRHAGAAVQALSDITCWQGDLGAAVQRAASMLHTASTFQQERGWCVPSRPMAQCGESWSGAHGLGCGVVLAGATPRADAAQAERVLARQQPKLARARRLLAHHQLQADAALHRARAAPLLTRLPGRRQHNLNQTALPVSDCPLSRRQRQQDASPTCTPVSLYTNT